MPGGVVAARHKQRWRSIRAGALVFGLLALGAWGLGQTPPPAPQDAPLPSLIRSFVAPGEAKPILLSADAIATWPDAGYRIFLLRGHVKIEQGLTVLSFSEGTVWIDEN